MIFIGFLSNFFSSFFSRTYTREKEFSIGKTSFRTNKRAGGQLTAATDKGVVCKLLIRSHGKHTDVINANEKQRNSSSSSWWWLQRQKDSGDVRMRQRWMSGDGMASYSDPLNGDVMVTRDHR